MTRRFPLATEREKTPSLVDVLRMISDLTPEDFKVVRDRVLFHPQTR
jgi:hypothetical protein